MQTLLFIDQPQLAHLCEERVAGRAAVKVVNVGSGKEALDIIRPLNPALIITESALPDMLFMEFYRRIKSGLLARSLPFIILYDPARPESRPSLDNSSDEALTKPIDLDVLIRKICERLTLPIRRHQRASIEMHLFYFSTPKAVTKGFVRNISAGGIYIETFEPVNRGTKLVLSLQFPGQECNQKALASVVHCGALKHGSLFGLGLQFIEIERDILQKLHTLSSDALSTPTVPAESFTIVS